MSEPSRMPIMLAVVVAVLTACLALLVASVESAKASFPGNNGLIAFAAPDDDSTYEIFTSTLDGSSLKQRTNAEGSSWSPSWSPDGNKIVFLSDRDGQDSEIYVKDITTGKISRLTNNVQDPGRQPPNEYGPVWSPDGTKIAFSRAVGEVGGGEPWFCSVVHVMDADGSDDRFVPNAGGCIAFVEEWSPDGSKIAYIAKFEWGDPGYDIWVMKPDGSEHKNLTNSYDFNEYDVDWKPNGKKMTYSRYGPPSYNTDIWKMSSDGSHKDRLTFTSTQEEAAPIWAPNGRKILFTSRAGCIGCPTQGVVIMNVDGTNKASVPGLTSASDWQPVPTP